MIMEKSEMESINAPVGIIQRLWEIGSLLYSLEQEGADAEKKGRYYKNISIRLEKDQAEIQKMLNQLNDGSMPEKVRNLCGEIDEKYIASFNLFLDGIDYFLRYMETGEIELVDEGQRILMEGADLLEQGNVLVGGLAENTKGG
jgi:hypothetical protein